MRVGNTLKTLKRGGAGTSVALLVTDASKEGASSAVVASPEAVALTRAVGSWRCMSGAGDAVEVGSSGTAVAAWITSSARVVGLAAIVAIVVGLACTLARGVLIGVLYARIAVRR